MRRSFACAFALLAVLSLLQYIANTRFILVFATVVVVVSILLDVSYALVDPRIRRS